MESQNLKSWPFDEAKKILNRLKDSKETTSCIFETGYGPSGLPHIGTFGEVVRTSMVIKALKSISSIKTKLYVFSDDMDGLRKVPENIPNRELIKNNLNRSLSSIPDPFEKYDSFAEYNNNKLRLFLDRFGFDYEFKSSTNLYKSGFFNDGLKDILRNYEKVRNIIIPTLGKERRATYSPFLPICKNTGRVLEVKVEDFDPDKNSIKYVDPLSKKVIETSILNGECKLQWKVDWAMRWKTLSVDYEMNGKDLIESFQLSSKINKIIGGRPPVNLTYELFLDENGEKISKSIGNGISVDDWLRFSPKESLELFMFQAPRKAKRLFFDVIPKTTDEYLRYKSNYKDDDELKKKNNPVYFIDTSIEEEVPKGLTFNMILNLASVCNTESNEVLWGFIETYYPNVERESSSFLNSLLNFGVNYYKAFILPNKKYRAASVKEKLAFVSLLNFLESINGEIEPEEIQNKLYEIGRNSEFDSLKDWFGAFYQVILGQKEGPRLGSFIKFYGIEKTILLIKSKLNI